MTLCARHNPIFAALDVDTTACAESLAHALAPHIGGVKLGLEFFNAAGRAGYRTIAECGLPIFLDLKLHDIPNTVAGAVRALAPLAPTLLTVHISGGLAMMRAAREAAQESATPPKIIGVTLLTSLDASDLGDIGFAYNTQDGVLRLAELAAEAGLDGVVCAPYEIETLRKNMDADFTLVVPGLRAKGDAAHDQKRAMTPQTAYERGADILVVGRSITAAPAPAEAAQAIAATLALQN